MDNFGDFLRRIRKMHNMSIEELSIGICSPRQLGRIERGESEPSIYMLTQLSEKLHFDLHSLYRCINRKQKARDLEYLAQLRIAFQCNNFDSAKQILDEIEFDSAFQSGYNLELFLYYKAIYMSRTNQDRQKCLDLCKQALFIECPSFDVAQISKTTFSYRGYCILDLMLSLHYLLEEDDNFFSILTSIKESIETFYINTPLQHYTESTELYTVYANIFVHFIRYYKVVKQDYEKMEHYVDEAIEFCHRKNLLRNMPELMEKKAFARMQAAKYEDAFSYATAAKTLKKLYGQPLDKVDEILSSIQPYLE